MFARVSVAYWKSTIFGFTDAGELLLIDPVTGAATLAQAGPRCWAAAVTTSAPVILSREDNP